MNIQENALQIYNNNLTFLESHDKPLFDRINNLSYAIEQNLYHERLFLEYKDDINAFNVYDNEHDLYLYTNQNDFNKKAISESKKDTDNSILTIASMLRNRVHADISNIQSTTEAHFAKLSNFINQFKSYFPDHQYQEIHKIKRIDKFIFVGTLLGGHIEQICNNLDPIICLIYEGNLELFRLSLFCTDYSKIAQNRNLKFSIMDDEKELNTKLLEYLNAGFESSFMVKYYSTNYATNHFFDTLLNAISLNSPLTFTYIQVIEDIIKRGLENMKLYPTFINTKHHTILNDLPVLFISAGPSFNTNLEWIKENKNKFFIVAIAAVVKKLLENDIIPDIITTLDGDNVMDFQFKGLDRDKLNRSILLASTMTHKNMLNYFNHDNIFLYEAASEIKETTLKPNGFSIGEITYILIFQLGANIIYTIGNDLSLDQATGSTHFDEYDVSKKFTIENQDFNKNSFMKNSTLSLNDEKIVVKGNFKKEVITTALFSRSIMAYNYITNSSFYQEKEVKTYNLSDGAYLDNMSPTDITTVTIKDTIKNVQIKQYLISNCSSSLTPKEKELIYNVITFLDYLIVDITEIRKLKVKSFEQFFSQIDTLIGKIITHSSYYRKMSLDLIFINYLKITLPFLYYKHSVNNQDKNIKHIKKLWLIELESICNELRQILKDNI